MSDESEQPTQGALQDATSDATDGKEMAGVAGAEVPPEEVSPSETEALPPADALGDEMVEENVDTMSVIGPGELGEGIEMAVDDAASILGSIPGSVRGSVHGSIQGSVHGSIQGSVHGSIQGLVHGSIQGSVHGSIQGSVHGSIQGSVHGSIQGSVHGSSQGSAHGSIQQKEGEQPEGVEGEGETKAEDKVEATGEGEKPPDEAKAPAGDMAPEVDITREIEDIVRGDGEASEEGEDGNEHEEEGEKEEKEEDEEEHIPVAQRKSGSKRRSSIGHHPLPVGRISGEVFDLIPQIAGEFHTELDDDRTPNFDFEAFEPDEPEYELQEEEEKQEEEVKVIDRPVYYELARVYDKQAYEERTKNNYLQRRMTEYFKRRRMMHVLRESMYESDTQAKYERKLDALDHLIDISMQETERIKADVDELRKKRDDKKAELAQFFNKMQKKELATGQDLLNNKGPKYNVEMVVEQYLKSQRYHLDLMIKMRLKYIKLRDRVYEKQAELKALDHLGENLHLIDYEQLKINVRNNSDKLEEKDGELVKIREHCQNSMQILAHFREKSGAFDADIDMYNDQLEEVVREHDMYREQLLYLKQERDNYRAWTNKLRADSGLLTKPVLLRDMEDSLNEVKSAAEKLQVTKYQYNTLRGQVMAVRKHMENYKEKRERQLSLTAIDVRKFSTASRGSRSRAPRLSRSLLRERKLSRSSEQLE